MRPRSGASRASSEQQRSKVGFPIRRFTDQSLFAAPHDLSQRTTSFIASQRQGIHQIPLRHLIALIAKARVFLPVNRQSTGTSLFGIEKTSFASNASGDLSGQAPNPRLVALSDHGRRRSENGQSPSSAVCRPMSGRPNALPLHDVRYRKAGRFEAAASRQRLSKRPCASTNETDKIASEGYGVRPAPAARPSSQRSWWSQTGSNRRPHACKARALPTELWPLSRRCAKRSNPRTALG